MKKRVDSYSFKRVIVNFYKQVTERNYNIKPLLVNPFVT